MTQVKGRSAAAPNAPHLVKLSDLRTLPLRQAVAEVCRSVAEVSLVDVVDDRDRYYCYVQMANLDRRFQLLHEIGGFQFGDGVCFIIPKNWDAPT